MNGKNSPKKVTLAMMKGKPITCSVPVIHYHANNDELEEIYSSAEDESLSKDSPTTPSKTIDKKLVRGTDPSEANTDGKTVTAEGNLSEGTPPSSDPWKVFSEIRGKLTKTFEEKFSEIKSEKRKKSPSPKDHSSRSDSEDFTDLTPTESQKSALEKQTTESAATSVRRKTHPVSYVGFSRIKTGLKDEGFRDDDTDNVENVENVESGVEAAEFSQDCESAQILRPESLKNSPIKTMAATSRDHYNDAISIQQKSPTPYNLSTPSGSSISLKTILLHLLKQVVCQITCRFAALLAAALSFFFLAPLPEYILGFIMGLFTTIFFWSAVTKLKQILTTMPEENLLPNPTVPVLEIPAVEEHAVVERFHGWVNELPYAYESDNYHVARTKSVFFRLEGDILRIMETRTKIPKRTVWDEPRHKLKFTKRRVLNLIGAKIELLPYGLARRRRWSKKYPICITFAKGALSSNVTLKTSIKNGCSLLGDQTYKWNAKPKRKRTKKGASHDIKEEDDEEQKAKRKEEGKNERESRPTTSKEGEVCKNDGYNDDDYDEYEEYEEYEELEEEYEDFDDEFEELVEEYLEDEDDEEYEEDEDYEEYEDDEDEFEKDEYEKDEDSKEKDSSIHDNDDADKKEEKLIPEEDEKRGEIKLREDRKAEKKEEEEEAKGQAKAKDKKEDGVTRFKGLKELRSRPKSNDESKTEKKMYIFARADREKEDWYRRLVLAASRVPNKNQDSVPQAKDKATASSNPPSTGVQPIQTESKAPVAGNNSSEGVNDLSYKAYMRKYLETTSPSASETVPSTVIEDTLWVNCLLARLIFDMHKCPETINLIQDKIQRKLSNIKLPYFMECLIVSEVRIGQEAPIIRNITKPVNNERGFWFDLNITYKGCLTMTVETKLNLMKLTKTGSISNNSNDMFGTEKPKSLVTRSPIFDSDVEDTPETSTEDDDTSSKMQDYTNPNKEATPVQSSGKKFLSMVDRIAANKYFQHATELSYVRRAMEGVSNKEIRLMVTVSGVEGCLSVNIPPAPSDRLWYGFKTVPRITLTVKPAVGERTVNIVSVTKWIETKLLREFEKLVVLPNMDDLVLPLCPNYPNST